MDRVEAHVPDHVADPVSKLVDHRSHPQVVEVHHLGARKGKGVDGSGRTDPSAFFMFEVK